MSQFPSKAKKQRWIITVFLVVTMCTAGGTLEREGQSCKASFFFRAAPRLAGIFPQLPPAMAAAPKEVSLTQVWRDHQSRVQQLRDDAGLWSHSCDVHHLKIEGCSFLSCRDQAPHCVFICSYGHWLTCGKRERWCCGRILQSTSDRGRGQVVAEPSAWCWPCDLFKCFAT